jgi:two-component system response regulator AtoC
MFELADGGTILLDEIGDMDFRLQAKLLQVLQDQQFQRLGGKETIKVDVRVIAATHRDLENAIADERFRADLYYRLNVISIRVPPLREHREDIIGMAEFLLKKHAVPGAAPVPLPPALRESFAAYAWPGNIRELENIIRKFMVLRDARIIEQELRGAPERTPAALSIPPSMPAPAAEFPQLSAPVMSINADPRGAPAYGAPVLEQVEMAKREAERVAILTALRSANWNRRRAAAALQVDYKALLYKMKRLEIRKEEASPAPIKGVQESTEAMAASASSGKAELRVA